MKFPWKGKTVIIATKGFPFNGSWYVCSQISSWEKCPVLRVDAILEKLYEQKNYNATHRPSIEEEDDLQRLAFSIACGVARSQMSLPLSNLKCVIIQSHLDRLFQLDQLIQLSSQKVYAGNDPHKIIILELRVRHKYLWKDYVATIFDAVNLTKRWFVPRNWNEVEKAIVDYDAQVWDKHYDDKCKEVEHMKRLVLDPLLDIALDELISKEKMSLFGKCIEYLLDDKGAPSIVVYHAWRKKLVQGLVDDPNNNNNDIKLCSKSGADCIFIKSKKDDNKCRACDKDRSYYKCISCSLALCKPCAELPHHPVDGHNLYPDLCQQQCPPHTQTQACKSCSDAGKTYSDQCGACRFETHLKYTRLVPTVIDNPLLHPHLLSLQFTTLPNRGMYNCTLCTILGYDSQYYCVICNYSYHIRCVHSLLQLEHCHGGHHHHLNLVLPPPDKEEVSFSRDDYLNPNDFWCEVCYRDMDSSAAYYSCQHCPQYVAHLYCISKLWEGVKI